MIVSPLSPPVPAELVGKIWRGEYVEMAELLPAALQTQDDASRSKKEKKRKREEITSGL